MDPNVSLLRTWAGSVHREKEGRDGLWEPGYSGPGGPGGRSRGWEQREQTGAPSCLVTCQVMSWGKPFSFLGPQFSYLYSFDLPRFPPTLRFNDCVLWRERLLPWEYRAIWNCKGHEIIPVKQYLACVDFLLGMAEKSRPCCSMFRTWALGPQAVGQAAPELDFITPGRWGQATLRRKSMTWVPQEEGYNGRLPRGKCGKQKALSSMHYEGSPILPGSPLVGYQRSSSSACFLMIAVESSCYLCGGFLEPEWPEMEVILSSDTKPTVFNLCCYSDYESVPCVPWIQFHESACAPRGITAVYLHALFVPLNFEFLKVKMQPDLCDSWRLVCSSCARHAGGMKY